MVQPSRPSAWQKSMQEAGPYLGLGMQMALSMAFFILGGYWLDRWLGTSPWLLLAGALLGVTAVFTYLFRLAANLRDKPESEARETDTELKGEESPRQPEAGGEA